MLEIVYAWQFLVGLELHISWGQHKITVRILQQLKTNHFKFVFMLSSMFHPWGLVILFYNQMINWTSSSSLSMFRLKAFVTNRLISNDYFNISLDVEKLFRKYRWLGYPQIWSVEILQWPHDSNHYYFCILLVDSLG